MKLNEEFKYVGEKVILRFYQKEDFLLWQEFLSDMNPKQNQWDWEAENIQGLTKERYEKKLSTHKSEREDDRVYYFCVEDKLSHKLIGMSILNHVDREASKAELGFQINNKYWGMGFGKDIVATSLNIAFESLKLALVYAEVNPENFSSLHILTKLGFEQVGITNAGRILLNKLSDMNSFA
jgi:ribosomal-protein-alanine N-acetyltransferase